MIEIMPTNGTAMVISHLSESMLSIVSCLVAMVCVVHFIINRNPLALFIVPGIILLIKGNLFT